MPLVGVSSCRQQQGDHFYDVAGVKYIDAVLEAARTIPLLIPAVGARLPTDALLDRLDGLLLTGSPSNVDPALYGALPVQHDGPGDSARDATTLPLIRAAIGRDMPILAICRGHQELNVALGGTLHQQVSDVPGRIDHRADHCKSVDVQYGPAHRVELSAAGYLAGLSGERSIEVNSLHEQGIAALAPGLTVEATAPDSQIEAVRPDARDLLHRRAVASGMAGQRERVFRSTLQGLRHRLPRLCGEKRSEDRAADVAKYRAVS